ncbi:MAG: response regulator [Planctomycetaceae bacterium]|jgi:signal transduction histidine kinase/ActR/RegA family two-component response regulator|nr:response regulator [Planctomycetaceae bacterium]
MSDIVILVISAGFLMLIASIWAIFVSRNWICLTVAWLLFVLVISFGSYKMHQSENEMREFQKLRFIGAAHACATAATEMRHWEIPTEVKPEDGEIYKRYEELLDMFFQWQQNDLKAFSIYTMRKGEDGLVRLIISPAADINGDGQINAVKTADNLEAPESPGYVFVDYDESMDGVFSGKDKWFFSQEANEEIWGSVFSVVVPIKKPNGEIEAVLGIDIFEDDFLNIVRKPRVGYLISTLLGVTMVLIGFIGVVVLLRSLQRMKKFNSDLGIAKQVAESASLAKTDFLANMSHEIRTPMNAVLGFLDLVVGDKAESLASDERREMIQIVRQNAQKLLAILNNILDISMVDANRMKVHWRAVSVRTVIDEVVQQYSSQATYRRDRIYVHIDPSVPMVVLSDGTRLRQILANLVDNAIKFTQHGTIHIKCSATKSADPPAMMSSLIELESVAHVSSVTHVSSVSSQVSVVASELPQSITSVTEYVTLYFEIIDTGIGIPEDKIGQIFIPFVQADTSLTRIYGGTGLGLSVAKRLSQMLRGDLTAKSVEGKGSVFTLVLHTRIPDEDEIASSAAITTATGRTPFKSFKQQVAPISTSPNLPPDESPSQILKIGDHPSQLGSDSSGGFVVEQDMGAKQLDSVASQLQSSSAQSLNEFETTLNGCNVLLVEDVAINQLLISFQLREAGATVDVAENGQIGIDKINAKEASGQHYDVVLMDMQMPVLDGYEATKRLRQQGYQRPIIALTAHALAGDREKTLECGCDDYSTKPIDRTTLIDLISHLVSLSR